MKRLTVAALAALMAGASAPAAFAQRFDHGHREVHRHHDWRPGHRLAREEWRRGRHIDWRARRLRRPPRGYEWREVDGDYVMAAVATGVIASIVANSR